MTGTNCELVYSVNRKMFSNLEQEKMAHGVSPWTLVSRSGQTYPLPQTMVFLGRDDKCDIVIESRSVNPHHAILNYDSKENKFRIKDLGSVNGTYVNESRIPEEEFFTLDDKDTIRFGYDPTVYHMAQVEDSSHHAAPPDNVSKSSAAETQNAWTSRENRSQVIHGLAECPGCIAEQDIQHTCGIRDENGSNHGNQCISNVNKPSTSTHTTTAASHPPNLTPCQHRRNKWHETAYHVEEYSGAYLSGQEYEYYYEDPENVSGYGAVSATESIGVVPATYVYDTVAETSSHIVHNSSGPVQGSIHPTVLVRHIYHTGAPPQFVAGPPRLPVSYIAPYADPYLVPHGARIQKGMSSQQDDPSATSLVPDDSSESVTLPSTANCDTNDLKPATSTSCLSRPPASQLVVSSGGGITTEFTASHRGGDQTVATTTPVSSVTDQICDTNQLVQPVQLQPTLTEVKCSVAPRTENNGAIVTAETPSGAQKVTSPEQHDQHSHQETQTDLNQLACEEKPIRDDNSNNSEEASQLVKSDSAASSLSKTPSTPASPPLIHRQDKRRSISSGQDAGLETVKKGTPLYGQPSWWGEEDADEYKYPHTSTLTEKDKIHTDTKDTAERPSSLNFNGTMSSDNKQQTHPQYGATYMEIPKDLTDKPASTNHDAPHTPPERDTGPATVETLPLSKSNTAFTVDFGDEDEEVKAATKNRPIGEFLPSGLRRSFRQREEKIKEMQEKKKEEREQLSGPEMSPARQRKAYNWHSSNSRTARKNSLSPQRSGYHSDGHHSNMSSDNEDLSIRSESFTGRAKRIKQAGRSVSVTEKHVSTFSSSRAKSARTSTDKRKSTDSRRTPVSDSRRTPTSVDNRRTPTSSEKRGKAEHRKTPTGEKKKKTTVATVSSDSAYLINKMFASQGSLPDAEHDSMEYEHASSPKKHERKHKTSAVRPQMSDSEPLRASQRSLRVPKNDDDAGSETGTYTIQGEKEQKEIENARKSIDKVFGVVDHQEYVIEVQRPVIDLGTESPTGEYSPTEEQARQRLDSQDLDGMEEDLEEHEQEDEYNEQEAITGKTTDWIRQAIKQGKSAASSTTTESSEHSSPLHQQARRVRPGTGRKLPSPPVNRSLSAGAAIEGSCVETDLSGGRHRATVTFDSGNGGTFLISFDAPQREVTSTGRCSSDQTSDVEQTGKQGTADKSSSADKTKSTDQVLTESSDILTMKTQKKKIVIVHNDSQSLPISKEELLIPIKDTDSDTDSSTCAIIASRHEQRVSRAEQSKEKPKFGRSKSTGPAPKGLELSPRAKSTERRPVTAPRAKSTERRTAKMQDTGQKVTSVPKTKKLSGTRSRTNSTNKDLSTSDGPSESESASIISSSTDYSETSPRMVRKTSGGKGSVLLTRTNRTAVLRRQKLEMDSESNRSDSSTLTPRSSRPNSTSFDTPKVSPRASSRSRSSSRSRPLSAQEASRSLKTDLTLGQRIVDKSRENQRLSSSSKDITSKYSRSVSCKSSVSSPRSKSETKETRPRSGKSTGSGAGLIVSGNRSQPSSRSNSPRTQEYNAWKRRKSYDPRQAVAEAKATKKVNRSKSAVNDHDKSTHSVSSSEDSANLDDGCGESSRTDDIIKLSTEIYKNLAAMSRENDNEEVDILMTRYEEFESQLVSRNLSDAHQIPSLPSSFSFSNGQYIDKSRSPNNSASSDDNSDENSCVELEQDVLDTKSVDVGKSYNTIILRSIFEISNRVRHKTDALMEKLKRSHDLHNIRGPDNIQLDGDSPGLQELAGILSNLRTTERHLQVIDRALFPRPQTKGTIHDSKHVKELERIRSELADFKPAEKPGKTWGKKMHKQASHESDRSEPFTGDDYCHRLEIQEEG